MGETKSWLHGEPNLREVMLDPMVQQAMCRDGLTPDFVWPIIRATTAQLRGDPGWGAEAARAARAYLDSDAVVRARGP